MGLDEAIKYLVGFGVTQRGIGLMVDRDQSTISRRLSRLRALSPEQRNQLIRTKTEYDYMLRRLRGDGVDLLLLLNDEGPLESRRLKRKAVNEWEILPIDYPATYRRCKAFDLIKPTRLTGKKNYYVDITEKGLSLVAYWKQKIKKEAKEHAKQRMVETDRTVKKRH